MPVFLSHKREDKQKALDIARYLKIHEIDSYVDVLDPALQSTDDITKKLIERIGECTHLMAVVSNYTDKSWWVPFEIGIGTEKDRRITSYQLTSVQLPEFLKKWPILKNTRDLDAFVRLYKQDGVFAIEDSTSSSFPTMTADSFHRQLKTSIGQ